MQEAGRPGDIKLVGQSRATAQLKRDILPVAIDTIAARRSLVVAINAVALVQFGIATVLTSTAV